MSSKKATFVDTVCRDNACAPFKQYSQTPPFDDSATISKKTTIQLNEKLRGVPALFIRIKVDKAANFYYNVSGNLVKDSEGLKSGIWKILNNYIVDKIIIEPISDNTTYFIHASTVTPQEFEQIVKTMQVPPIMSMTAV